MLRIILSNFNLRIYRTSIFRLFLFCLLLLIEIKFNLSCTSHDMKYLEINTKRLTAIGCQNGFIGVYFIDSNKNEILKYWDQENDSFITQLHFFTTKTTNDWSQIGNKDIKLSCNQ